MVKQNSLKNQHSDMNKRQKILIPIIIAVITVGGSMSYYHIQQQADAQNMSLGEFGNVLSTYYPKSTILHDNVSEINDVEMSKLSDVSTVTTIERDEKGVSNAKEILNRASIEMHHGIALDGKDVISSTITNLSNEVIYVKSFIITGETSAGTKVVESYIIDADYDKSTFGNIPKPTIMDYVELKPGNSISGHMSGKWTVANMPVDNFSAGGVLVMDPAIEKFSSGNYLSISIGPLQI